MIVLKEKPLTTRQRKRLPDSAFGLPDTREFPLCDAERVKSAMSYFHNCPDNKKKELAKNILKAAQKFDVKINKEAKWYQWV